MIRLNRFLWLTWTLSSCDLHRPNSFVIWLNWSSFSLHESGVIVTYLDLVFLWLIWLLSVVTRLDLLFMWLTCFLVFLWLFWTHLVFFGLTRTWSSCDMHWPGLLLNRLNRSSYDLPWSVFVTYFDLVFLWLTLTFTSCDLPDPCPFWLDWTSSLCDLYIPCLLMTFFDPPRRLLTYTVFSWLTWALSLVMSVDFLLFSYNYFVPI